ncbi:MAG TPA: hypothetical protein PLW46_02895 [Acinetobacter johnsonii]|nr:hypothetical protein [Acinetobacter johnsonii]
MNTHARKAINQQYHDGKGELRMPQYSFNVGYGIVYTANIPTRAMQHVKTNGDSTVAGFELTPAFRQAPSLIVADIREAGIQTPGHWGDTNEVIPVIHGVAFYLTPQFTNGMAMSAAMKGVNLRTGMPEEEGLTDEPSQSYWATAPAWIDGYVPGHREGVRQFLPLQEEAEMAFDVARMVGITPDNPWLDAISAGFYLPRDLRKLSVGSGSYDYLEGLEGVSFGAKGGGYESLRGDGPSEVGMGAGAVMKQRHAEDPTVHATDFITEPFIRVTTRLVWLDWWNQAAEKVGVDPLTVMDLRSLRQQQESYERRLWAQLNIPAETAVDGFAMPK